MASPSRAFYKEDDNNGSKLASTSDTHNNRKDKETHWNLVPADVIADQPTPFAPSTEASTTYYKIANANTSTATYYILPPTGTTGNDIYANTTSEDGDNIKWYFKKAGEDAYLTYYYIINAVTGEYLYYNSDVATGNRDRAFITKSVAEKTDENADRYQFVFPRTATSATDGYYYIVPKPMRYVSTPGVNYYLVWRDSTNPLKVNEQRSDWGRKWTFESTSFKCATPVFVYDNLQNMFSITCATPGAKIYYKGYNVGDAVPTFTFPGDRGTLYTGAPFEKVFDNYVAVAARCIDDGSDKSDVATGDASSMRYSYHIIDKNHNDLLQIGSNDETLGMPEAYRSPLVTRYHYFTAANFDTTSKMPTGSEMTSLSDLGNGQDIYVTYDVSARIKLDGSQYYMLRYENPAGTELWEEVSDLPQGIPTNSKNTVYYPYTNGKEGFNLYGDEKKNAAFDDGESTRTRYLWYFEGGDPYRIKIRSFNTVGPGSDGTNKYHAEVGPYASYFYTFYGNGGNSDKAAAVHTVLTQTDRTNHQPTEYMILNGHGGSSSFPYRLMTTAKDGTTSRHLEVTTFDHQWLNSKKSAADALSNSRTANWYHMPDLGGFTKTHADHTNIWYETVAMGSDFSIELVTLSPVLHLVDNHGWEIAH